MKAALPADMLLPPVMRLSPRVIRVLGMNPGPKTLGGTNTYIVGTGKERVLVDTGEGAPSYIQSLVEGLRLASVELNGHPVSLSTIVLTHWHKDHVGGVDDVLKLFPRANVLKKHSSNDDRLGLPKTVAPLPTTDGAIRVEGATLRWVPTPGHTDDYTSLLLEEEHAVFTGDCILGAGSSVFACFSDFMSSLETLKTLSPKGLYPGHGPYVQNGMKKVDEYISNRRRREEQVLASLGDESLSIKQIVERVYTDTPTHLHGAAAINVWHHLRKLCKEGVVKHNGGADHPLLDFSGMHEGSTPVGTNTLVVDVMWCRHLGSAKV